jgi:hypothetical protein
MALSFALTMEVSASDAGLLLGLRVGPDRAEADPPRYKTVWLTEHEGVLEIRAVLPFLTVMVGGELHRLDVVRWSSKEDPDSFADEIRITTISDSTAPQPLAPDWAAQGCHGQVPLGIVSVGSRFVSMVLGEGDMTCVNAPTSTLNQFCTVATADVVGTTTPVSGGLCLPIDIALGTHAQAVYDEAAAETIRRNPSLPEEPIQFNPYRWCWGIFRRDFGWNTSACVSGSWGGAIMPFDLALDIPVDEQSWPPLSSQRSLVSVLRDARDAFSFPDQAYVIVLTEGGLVVHSTGRSGSSGDHNTPPDPCLGGDC